MNKKLLEYFGNDSLAASVWEGKYKYKDEETPKDMHRRMSKEFYRIDKKYQEDEPADKNKLSEYGQKREKREDEEEKRVTEKKTQDKKKGSQREDETQAERNKKKRNNRRVS